MKTRSRKTLAILLALSLVLSLVHPAASVRAAESGEVLPAEAQEFSSADAVEPAEGAAPADLSAAAVQRPSGGFLDRAGDMVTPDAKISGEVLDDTVGAVRVFLGKDRARHVYLTEGLYYHNGDPAGCVDANEAGWSSAKTRTETSLRTPCAFTCGTITAAPLP